jgi:hypothetical protein
LLHAWISAKLEDEEGDEQFWFEEGSDADRRVRIEIQIGFTIFRGIVRYDPRSPRPELRAKRSRGRLPASHRLEEQAVEVGLSGSEVEQIPLEINLGRTSFD